MIVRIELDSDEDRALYDFILFAFRKRDKIKMVIEG